MLLTLCVGVAQDALPALPPGFAAKRRPGPPLLEGHSWWDISSTLGAAAYRSPAEIEGGPEDKRRQKYQRQGWSPQKIARALAASSDERHAGVHAELRDWLWQLHLDSAGQAYVFVHAGEDAASPPAARQLLCLGQAAGGPLLIPADTLCVLITS